MIVMNVQPLICYMIIPVMNNVQMAHFNYKIDNNANNVIVLVMVVLDPIIQTVNSVQKDISNR